MPDSHVHEAGTWPLASGPGSASHKKVGSAARLQCHWQLTVSLRCRQAFLEKYSADEAGFTKHPEKYIRYSVADVQRLIEHDLFESRDRELGGGAGGAAKPGGIQRALHSKLSSSSHPSSS